MAKKLNSYVHVVDPDTNANVVLEPGTTPDKKYDKQLGDHLFTDLGETEAGTELQPVAGPGQSATTLSEADLEAVRAARAAEAERVAAEEKAAAEVKAQAEKEAAEKAAAEAAAAKTPTPPAPPKA